MRKLTKLLEGEEITLHVQRPLNN